MKIEHGVHYLAHCCVTAMSALQNMSKDKSEQIMILFSEWYLCYLRVLLLKKI